MDNQNRELQKQEVLPSKIGEVEKFHLSKKAVKIQDASLEEISLALKLVMAKIGLRAANFPAPWEKGLLISHLIENFGENTVEEIKLAFDWGIQGRTGAEMNCYENFSCLYLSAVMSKYVALAAIVRPVEDVKPLELPPIELKEDDLTGYNDFIQSEFAKTLMRNGVKIPKF